MPDEPFAEGVERLDVVRHRVVVVVPGKDAGKPAPLFWDRQVHASPHLPLEGMQLRAHPLRVGDPLELEPPRLPGPRAHVREAEKLEPAPRGAMRKEMTDIKHLIRAGWNAGPGLMQPPGEAGDGRGAGSRDRK